MRNDRLAAVDLLDREGKQRALLLVGEADRLADMHRQRETIRAAAVMEFDQLGERVVVDTIVTRKRRHRRVHEAWLKL
jgi:hypothetical protein